VKVQQTSFAEDVLGRYVCNDWDEVMASLADGGFPFDAIVIGAGMFGGLLCREALPSGHRHRAARSAARRRLTSTAWRGLLKCTSSARS
jgi:hypothetical protein